MSEMIEARGLRKVYKNGAKELEVLKGIDLKVGRSEVLAVLGPSGAGKSTLLHLLGGLDQPTSGEVMIDGADIYALGDSERARTRNRKIGFVFQSFNLIPNYTTLENVMLPLIISGTSSSTRKEKAYSYLKAVGLESRADHLPNQLSGGERQRVSIARALVNDPKIIIADEPTGNLDSKKSAEIMDILRTLNSKQKMTIIVITHDPNVAKGADRILKMCDGKISR
jgi:putative ABC transport system ATP-binding protein